MPWSRRSRAGQAEDNPLPWLLDPATPAVRAATLQHLFAAPPDAVEVVAARRAAMHAAPIRDILAAQSPVGWWSKPGPGYSPKYTGTVWQVMFLEQLGADPSDERVRRGCDYVLRWTVTDGGGFGCSSVAAEHRPPPSRVIHCLNGNLVRALIGLGYLDDPRVQGAVTWAAQHITGEGVAHWYAAVPRPGFACGSNEGQPCAWGAVKELRGLARVPARRRTPLVDRAVATGVALLLSRDPAVADYPMGFGNTAPSSSWFRLGFPSGYASDVLQVLEVLAELGHVGDPRLGPAFDWLLAQRDADGRWHNRYAHNGRTTVDIERQGDPSKWVTLRAYAVLRAAGAL